MGFIRRFTPHRNRAGFGSPLFGMFYWGFFCRMSAYDAESDLGIAHFSTLQHRARAVISDFMPLEFQPYLSADDQLKPLFAADLELYDADPDIRRLSHRHHPPSRQMEPGVTRLGVGVGGIWSERTSLRCHSHRASRCFLRNGSFTTMATASPPARIFSRASPFSGRHCAPSVTPCCLWDF